MKTVKMTKTKPNDYEQIVKLSDLRNLGYIIANYNIKEFGFYTCLINKVKTLVVPDNELM